MFRVHILDKDICGGHCDLTILPCSGKMKKVEKPRNQARIDQYGLPSPADLRDKFSYGEISPIFSPSKRKGPIKYFAFAASVLNRSTPGALEKIGVQIGEITLNNPRIRIIEAPFLGCGDGGLNPRVAVTALAKGFLQTSHPNSILQLCSDVAFNVQMAENALEDLSQSINSPRESADAGSAQPKEPPRKYDIAVSFAGEQRSMVEQIVVQLKSHEVSVFYDNDEQAELWGENLYDLLYNIYANESRFCLVFVSDEYNAKEWTNHERQSAQERVFKERGKSYLLPVQIEGAKLKSMPSIIGYVPASLGVEKIVDLVLKKLSSDS